MNIFEEKYVIDNKLEDEIKEAVNTNGFLKLDIEDFNRLTEMNGEYFHYAATINIKKIKLDLNATNALEPVVLFINASSNISLKMIDKLINKIDKSLSFKGNYKYGINLKASYDDNICKIFIMGKKNN